MNVSLVPELQELVNEKVRSGQYGSSDEGVSAALQLLKERDQASIGIAKSRRDITPRECPTTHR